MDVQNQISAGQTKGACLSQPIGWSMAAMLRDSSVAAVMHTRPHGKPLAMTTMKKSNHGFPLVLYMDMGLGLVAHRASGAALYFVWLSTDKIINKLTLSLPRGLPLTSKIVWH